MRQRLDPTIRKEQIMAAALRVFAEKGFAEASNRDVAKEAGLNSPGLIYHYFPSKLDLLRSIVESKSQLREVLDNSDWLLSQPPEVTLTRIGELYLGLYDSPEAGLLMKVVLGEALRNEEFAGTFAQIGPLRILGLLTKYLESLMNAGKLRRIDPTTAARAFLGPFVILLVFRTVFDRTNQTPIDRHDVVANNVQIFLRGLLVEEK
jgi:TetR/AcrR family transcriptional repressor of mexJK operon